MGFWILLHGLNSGNYYLEIHLYIQLIPRVKQIWYGATGNMRITITAQTDQTYLMYHLLGQRVRPSKTPYHHIIAKMFTYAKGNHFHPFATPCKS